MQEGGGGGRAAGGAGGGAGGGVGGGKTTCQSGFTLKRVAQQNFLTFNIFLVCDTTRRSHPHGQVARSQNREVKKSLELMRKTEKD